MEKTVPQRDDIRVKGPSDVRQKKKKPNGLNGKSNAPKTTKTTGTFKKPFNGKKSGGQAKLFKPRKDNAASGKRKNSETADGEQKKKKKKAEN